MFKTITPLPDRQRSAFVLDFSVPTYTTNSTTSVLSSSAFKIGGIDHYFGDSPIPGTGNRNIYIYKLVQGTPVRVAGAGTITSSLGRVELTGFRADDDTPIKITVLPNSFDIAPKRNQLLDIDQQYVAVTAEIDSIAVTGAGGSTNYTTTPRHR